MIKQKFKEKVLDACAKAWVLYDAQAHMHTEKLRSFWDDLVLPSACQIIKNWHLSGKIANRIQQGKLGIEEDLGLWTPSFSKGLKDSGIFLKGNSTYKFLNIKRNGYFLEDLADCRLPRYINSKFKNHIQYISNCFFLEYGGESNILNEREYLGGLFTGSRIGEIKGENWLTLFDSKYCKEIKSRERIISILNKWKIIYKEVKRKIFISPFYGALFFGYMPIHSASRILTVQNAAMCPELPFLYYNICLRSRGKRNVAKKAWSLPFQASYATYYNKKNRRSDDIRKRGVEIGILGIHDDFRKLMEEWLEYNS